MKPLRQFAVVLVSFAALASIAGCGSGGNIATAPPKVIPPEVADCKTPVARPAGPATTANVAGAAFTGTVMAGSLPISGSSVQLYAAGSAGNGSTATKLGPAVVTDVNGAFSIATPYTCPFNLSLLYVVANGGQAGTTAATNSGTVLMATLGLCNSINSNPSFVVNEATTVASAYALAQFLSAGGNVGASATNFSGLALAAGTEANLVNTATGQAPGANFPATGTAPTPILNALANSLNACIVATSVSAAACTQLYSAAAISGTTPNNTLDAIRNFARHPATSVSTLFTLSTASTAFAPALSAAPSDWTMYATYAGGGLTGPSGAATGPSGLGVDSAGNIRVANYFGIASFFSNTGVPTIPNGITGTSLSESYGLAIDLNDNVWIPDEQAINGFGAITVLNSSGQSVSGANGFSSGGLNFPVAVSIDSNATSWVVDYGNSHLTLLSNTGTPLSGTSGYTTSQFDFPVAIAVDSKCYGFVGNQGGNTITRVAPDGSDFESFTTGSGASGLAVDAVDNVWVANYFGSTVGLLSSSAKVISSSFTGGGLKNPQGIAVDGGDNVWVANYRGPALTELAGASASQPGAPLSPSIGYGRDAKLLEAFALAIDASGNIWVTNFGSNTLTEFVGMAVPVRTPLIGPVVLP